MASTAEIELEIIPRTSDIGGYDVLRSLPVRGKRMVGPFIFWDQMGPGEFLAGQGMDVRPHPHIGLSTVTYLFEGEVDHRDSIGSFQAIRPGDVNLMTAGAGIVHSERTGAETRRTGSRIFGIQSWLAQSKATENGAPSFAHHAEKSLPFLDAEGKRLRLIMGEAFGLRSPVKTDWNAIYADIVLDAGAALPLPKEAEEQAVYLLTGSLDVGGATYTSPKMLVLKPGADITLRAQRPTRVLLLGGAVMDGPRYIFWNFVSSSQERIEQAKDDWRQGRFAKVPGDDKEFIPLPPDPPGVRMKPAE